MSRSKQDDPEPPDDLSKEPHGELDGFVLRDMFPDAHDSLAFQRRPISAILTSAVFMLDTSALLRAYGLNDAALNSVGAIYRDLIEGQRLFVPSHAIREFAHRRPQKIKDLHQQVSDAQRGPLRTTLAAFDRFPEHERIMQLEAEIADHLAERDRLLKNMLATIEGWQGDDPVNTLYRELFTRNVIVDPEIDGAALETDAERRFKNRIPPGFRDASKPMNATGDVLIWHSILAAGRQSNRHAILVSGEQKTDWFYRSKKKPLFERVELLDEYRRASGGRSLHIISFEEFLRQMKADAEVLKQAKRETFAQAAGERPRTHWGHHAERAVARWLRKAGFEALETNDFPDFVVGRPPDDTHFYVEVKLASSRPLYVAKANDVLARADSDKAEPLVIIFVALVEAHAELALRNLKRFFARNPGRVAETRIIVGSMAEESGEFEPIGEVLDRSTDLRE